MTATAITPLPIATARHPFSPSTLRRLRKQRGLTTTHFAVLIGRSPYTLAQYERGEFPPPVDVVALAASVLDVHPGALFVAAEEETP